MQHNPLVIYDLRFTTRATAVSAYGQRGCAAPQGRTADGAAVSQLSMYDLESSRVEQIFRIINVC